MTDTDKLKKILKMNKLIYTEMRIQIDELEKRNDEIMIEVVGRDPEIPRDDCLQGKGMECYRCLADCKYMGVGNPANKEV